MQHEHLECLDCDLEKSIFNKIGLSYSNKASIFSRKLKLSFFATDNGLNIVFFWLMSIGGR